MASLISKASLLMVPSVYEDGTLYNVLPSGNKAPDETGNHNGYDQTRADFTFSRGSNLAATRVNADGLIEKGRENITTFSNDPNNWIKSSASVTSGQSGYDGTNDAWLLTSTSAGGFARRDVSWSGVSTFSIYAKAGTADGMRIRLDAATDRNLYVNLSTGAIITDQTQIGYKIESVGSDWYRISSTNNIVTGINYRIYPTDASGTAIAGTIYIQDAQLEAGLVATDYIESGSVSGTAGVLENTPRIDYSSGAGALLLEPQRTNLIPNSEYFGSGSGWSLLNNVSVGNFVLSPEGKMNATQIIFDGSIGGRIERTISGLTAGANYSVSVYARVASGTQDVFFGSFEDTPAITLTTEWQRFEKTQPENDTNAYPRIRCEEAATIEIFGFQLEAGSHVSSYVPTYGSAATRGADVCKDAGNSDVFNDSEGTLFAEVFIEEDVESNVNISVSKGVHVQNLAKFIYLPSSDEFRFQIFGGATETSITTNNLSLGVYNKIAGSYDGSNIKLYINGVEIGTASTNQLPTGLNQFNFDRADGTAPFSGKCKQAIYFNEALSDSELADLTS